jgi:hypothetical protein
MSRDLYKKMYYRLFNRVTDAIEALHGSDPARAEAILIAAQQETEELFIEGGEPGH